jgi:hypothetical protein
MSDKVYWSIELTNKQQKTLEAILDEWDRTGYPFIPDSAETGNESCVNEAVRKMVFVLTDTVVFLLEIVKDECDNNTSRKIRDFLTRITSTKQDPFFWSQYDNSKNGGR